MGIVHNKFNCYKNWWVSLILGILFVIVSFWLMFSPVIGYEALVIVFSVLMFVSGVLEIIFSTSNRKTLSGWGWYLACGIIDLILGFFLMLYPEMTAVILPFFLAFWIMFRGFTAIGYSIDLSRLDVRGWGWYLVFGILGVICSFAIIWYPLAGALASVYIVAFAFLFLGIFRIMLAFDLRNLHKNSQELKERLAAIGDK